MLRSTFVHIPGIGYPTEAKLWNSGVRTWRQFFECGDDVCVKDWQRRALMAGIEESEVRLKAEDYVLFSQCLPHRELWRVFPEFRHKTAYLDIETTGLSSSQHQITVIGLFDGRRMRTFVRGTNLEDFPEEVEKHRVLVTYNGSAFDLPFLQASFPGLSFDQIHIDLRYPLKRLGFRGGLKTIERTVGIRRRPEIEMLNGWDAVNLWREYESGTESALDLLIEYNREDVVNLEKLMELAYSALRSSCFGEVFITYARGEDASHRSCLPRLER